MVRFVSTDSSQIAAHTKITDFSIRPADHSSVNSRYQGAFFLFDTPLSEHRAPSRDPTSREQRESSHVHRACRPTSCTVYLNQGPWPQCSPTPWRQDRRP